jgi:uncharacterized protein YqgC (DUF456 family)
MMWLHWTFTALFALLGAGCLLLVIMQLPGVWIMIGLGLLVQLADVAWIHGEAATPGWWAIGIAVVLAIIGEILEAASGAAGAKVGGGGRRSMWGGFIGGMVGALLGTFTIPIPIIGTFIGAIIGAFAGAMLGEVTGASAQTVRASVAPAAGAAAGRAAGTIFKSAIAVVVWLVIIAGLLIR